jgi:PhnB protein
MKLMPFLLFDGNCAEAMTFYQGCLDGELAITKVGDTPMKAQMPPAQHHKVAFANLKSGFMEFSATDWLHATRIPKQGNTVALYIFRREVSRAAHNFRQARCRSKQRTPR